MKSLIYILCVTSIFLTGCATVDYSFVNPDARVGSEKKVAVFPFAVSIDDYAALRVSKEEDATTLVNSIFVRELIRRTKYEIISPEEVNQILSIDKDKMSWICKSFFGDVYEKSALTSQRLHELGAALNAEAILVGKVTDFGLYQQDGVLWTGVGLQVKMVDVKTGEILWEARDKIKDVSTTTHSYSTLESKTAAYPIVSGGTAKEPKYKTGQGYFYGLSRQFPYHTDYKNTTLKLCRNIISTLPRY